MTCLWLVGAGLFAPAFAFAQTKKAEPADAKAPEPSRPVARLGVSKKAAERLGERRLKYLLAMEVDGLVDVEMRSAGPLGGDVLRIWVDLLADDRARIEVRRTGRPLAWQRLDLGKFKADVAARMVAIAASEMVRVQAGPRRQRPKPKPAPVLPTTPSPTLSGTSLFSSVDAMLLVDSVPTALVGPRLGLAHRLGMSDQRLDFRFLGSPWDLPGMWVEAAASISFRVPIDTDWRARFGGKLGVAGVSIPGGSNASAEASGLTFRGLGSATAAIETAITDELWWHLALEPGVVLPRIRSAAATDPFGGFAMGLSIGVVTDL